MILPVLLRQKPTFSKAKAPPYGHFMAALLMGAFLGSALLTVPLPMGASLGALARSMIPST